MAIRGLLGKLLKGAKEVAVPMAMAAQKERIQAKRDTTFRDFQKKESEKQRTFTAEQNIISRGDSKLKDELTRKNIEQMELAIESSGIDLKEKKELETLRNTYLNAPEGEEKKALLESYLGMQGKGQGSFAGHIIESPDPNNPFGAIRSMLVLDKKKGTVVYVGDVKDFKEKKLQESAKAKKSRSIGMQSEKIKSLSREEKIKMIMKSNPKSTKKDAIRYLDKLEGKISPEI